MEASTVCFFSLVYPHCSSSVPTLSREGLWAPWECWPHSPSCPVSTGTPGGVLSVVRPFPLGELYFHLTAWVLPVPTGTHSQSCLEITGQWPALGGCQGRQLRKSEPRRTVDPSPAHTVSSLWAFCLPRRRKTCSFSLPQPQVWGYFVSSLPSLCFYIYFKYAASLFLKYVIIYLNIKGLLGWYIAQ